MTLYQSQSQDPAHLLGGFSFLFPIHQFGSDSERRVAVVFENEHSTPKCMGPLKDVFRFDYDDDPAYESDFVAQTPCLPDYHPRDPKAQTELEDTKVLAKANAAAAKLRLYPLIPQSAVDTSTSMADLARQPT